MAGCRGDGVPHSQLTNGSDISVGGWGCRTFGDARSHAGARGKGIETHLATNKRREGSGCEARDRGPNPRRRRSPHREVCLVERRFGAA